VTSEVRPEQQTQVRLAMVIAALMMAHQVAGKATRDGIFLSQFSASALPAMVTVAAIAAVIASVLRSRTLVRLGPFRITAVSFAVSGVLQVGEWLLLPYFPRIAACGIYLHVVSFGAILLSGFWSLMNEFFDPRSAKQIFGRISGMGTLGGLCGGLLAERVAAWASSSAVVLALATLHLVCAALVWRAFPSTIAAKRAGPSRKTTVAEAVHRYPFLLTLAGLALAASASAALLDFVFKVQAAQTLGKGAPLLRFFGLYYTATSLLIFLVQTFITRFMLQHAGLGACVSALPATIAAGSLAALFIPGFKILGSVRGAEILMRGSLFRSAYELFFTAVSPADKRAVKSVLDVGIDRMGDAVGAGSVSLLLAVAPGRYGPILGAAFVCSAIAFLLAVHLQKGYLRALEKSLVNRAIELDPSLVEDSTTRSLLLKSVAMQGPAPVAAVEQSAPVPAPALPTDSFIRSAVELRSGDAPRAIQSAGKLGPADWPLAPLVINLLAWDQTMRAARDALERMSPKITGMLVDVLLDTDCEFVIRRRVPRVLAFVPSIRSAEGLFKAMEDQRFEVRFYSARALFLLLRDHPDLSPAPERIWTAVNRELSLQKPVWQSHRLLDSRDSRDADWFFDDQLQGRADRNLEHLFTLLALLLPADAVRIAFRALHTEDRELKGTAFEYLESATPPETRRPLLQLLEADAESRLHSTAPSGALEKLLKSGTRVNASFAQGPRSMEVRQ
jgi:AAA family ATP:ADP antiporter